MGREIRYLQQNYHNRQKKNEREKRKNFIHYGISLTALELVMANTLKYKHRITVAPFSLTTKKSVVLLALVDANYKFTIISVSGYGISSDGGLFTRSILGKPLETSTLNIPNFKPPPNSEKPMPFVIVGDEIFPPKEIFATTLPRSSSPER